MTYDSEGGGSQGSRLVGVGGHPKEVFFGGGVCGLSHRSMQDQGKGKGRGVFGDVDEKGTREGVTGVANSPQEPGGERFPFPEG